MRDIWTNLERRFATSERIAEGLFRKINDTAPIKNNSQFHKLEDLLDICKIINSSIPSCPELSVFNLRHGMKSVWEKLPDHFQVQWRSRYFRHEEETGFPPDFSLFIDFFERYLKEVSHPSFLSNTANTKTSYNVRTFATVNEASEAQSSTCVYHRFKGHSIDNCKSFSNLPFQERKDFVVKNKLCFLCFGKHFSNSCPIKSQIKCAICQMPHNSAMHFKKSNDKGHNSNSIPRNMQKHVIDSRGNRNNPLTTTNACTRICGSSTKSKICSKTLLVEVSVPNSSKLVRCLCIIDEQSDRSFCDPEFIKIFGLNPPSVKYCLTTATTSRTPCDNSFLVSGLIIRGVNSSDWLQLPPLLTLSTLPNPLDQVASQEIVASHPHLSHLAKYFPKIDDDAMVMILVGADSGNFMKTKQYGDHYPFVHETPLGYSLVGMACSNSESEPNSEHSIFKTSVDIDTYESLSAKMLFDSVEKRSYDDCRSPFATSPDDNLPGPSQEDLKFTKLMEEEIVVNEQGNLQLPLPLRDVKLPDNRVTVYHRTKNTLDRLRRAPEKLKSSLEVFDSYLTAGHVEPITSSSNVSSAINYIPIFPVYNEQKNKTRLVFDSSASFNGASLNNALMQGPDLNNSLVGVLLRFRLEEVAINADIEKMFHSFYVDPNQVDLLRFFWFKDNDASKEIVPYRARVHIFGNKPSPAIANFALRYTTLHCNLVEDAEACEFIRNHFYVDDALYSTSTVSSAIKVLSDARDILGKFNIRLCKILSSHKEVMNAFPASELADIHDSYDLISEDPQSKTLGVAWSPSQDTLSLCPRIPSRPFTKRGLLSVTSACYDPIGLVCPIVLKGRLFLRQIIPPKNQCTPELEDCGWDDPLPSMYQTEWFAWVKSLETTNLVSVRRCYKPPNFGKSIHNELHCFADASDVAIGLVIYLRQINVQNKISVSFVFANSKVAPRAAGTIPRLELCAALEVTRAVRKVLLELTLEISKIQFYTDSKIVLGYLQNSTKRFSRYVYHRIDEILKQSKVSQWRHIEGSKNIADIASRPQTIQSLLDSDWLSGPNFLKQEMATEEETSQDANIDLPEIKCAVTKSNDDDSQSITDVIARRTNSWHKARVILSYVFKFVHLLKKCPLESSNCTTCNLSLKEAGAYLIKGSQSEFQKEINVILDKKPLSVSSPLSNLSPFVDDADILRVGGRLRESDFPPDIKNPILLPSKHPITKMIVNDCHERVKHQGRYLTMGCIRQSGFHVHKGSAVVKKLISECVKCRRLRGSLQEQRMADLPPDRLEKSPPFSNVGLDLFGPYLVHDGQTTRRNNATKKVWGLLITCLVSRAVHIELLPYLDTSSLQLGLRRFYAIRGTCKRIRSDQGTNLIGARNQLFDLAKIQQDAIKHGVEWELNPPAASNYGGVWERQIGSIKRLLDSTLISNRSNNLSRDELNTYLQECASIINNTPLWETSNHPDDPAPLSPSNILTMRDSPNPPTMEKLTEADLLSYGKKRWKRVVYLCDQFWSRWRQLYLNRLQSRSKWIKPNEEVHVGDVVLVKGQSKRNEWPMGRIVAVKKSSDNLVRSVTVQLSTKKERQPRFIERSVRDTVLLVHVDSKS